MPAPIPIWWDVAGAASTLTWNCGIVDADSYSAEKEFHVWNNKGGVSDVSDMTNVFITTKDANGNDGGPVAGRTSAIVEVSIHSGSAFGDWEEIGGSDPAFIQSVNNMSDGLATIYGTANDGNSATAITKKNYADLKLRLHVLSSAPAGALSWKTRVSYQYT